ncbi:hypothetical protein PGB28_06605 [Primorskyibacter aestuariivivens]|uniref:hypothetical protein n=1 Tax=Primorskyibacter aestuariivivens TaxID=1888912 RepID=UPI002301EC5D|nr:hypothetical protein [Primorskyibacter aestuariivivens]MDA7428121.1 hypothetical protein [Primorskyibacter aestuariivivens]
MRFVTHSFRLSRICSGIMLSLAWAFTPAAGLAESIAPSCSAAADMLNTRFITVKALQSNDNIPEDSGILVHTIHGPGANPGAAGYLDFGALDALTAKMQTACTNPQSQSCRSYLDKTCGAYLSEGTFLPWCGSNHVPNKQTLSDASSWTFVRADTVIQGAQPGVDDEVVCAKESDYDKRYGLIFSNGYMNQTVNGIENLGCMYPMDGDTGFRKDQGCGISVRGFANQGQAEAQCPLSETSEDYESYFETLIETRGSVAGSLTCSLAKSQFNTWVDVRKRVDLSKTIWPVNEFVLWNWDSYTADDIAQNGFLIGIYYLSGCERAPNAPGDPQVAQRIAGLYKDWTGVDLPVVKLDNAAIRNRTDTPFACQ